MNKQLDLFDTVGELFGQYESLDNSTLYQLVAQRAGISITEMGARTPIGRSGQRRNIIKRKVRWVQQTLKHMNLIERAERGTWRITQEGKRRLPLRRINDGHAMLAFSSNLGVAIWADCKSFFSQSTDMPISLILTSPPYPLAASRDYGNPSEAEYVDFICAALEPIVKHLLPGGSLVLNVSNDIFLSKSPARSLYRERLVLALNDRLGLYKLDEIPWVNKSKPPGPIQWASMKRNQLNVGWEPIYWFSNDPNKVLSDNRRVLEPHSTQHLAYLARGEKRTAAYGDGAHRLRAGKSFSNITPGRIPKNVLEMGHACKSQRLYKRLAKAAGLPPHGAPFPLRLASFFIRLLTTEGNLVADPFGGSLTVPLAAQLLGREWIATDVIYEYLAGGGLRFDDNSGIIWNNEFLAAA